jgi:hypothetical protein
MFYMIWTDVLVLGMMRLRSDDRRAGDLIS